MTAVLDEVDAELLKALRVIRGDHDKKSGKSSAISNAIVSAIQTQGKDSTDQNADLLDAIKEQNTLLANLTEILSKKQSFVMPPTIEKEVVLANTEPEKAVAKAVTETPVFAALDKADSDEEEAAVAASAAKSTPIGRPSVTGAAAAVPRGASVVAVVEPAKEKKGGKKVITGPWAFVETNVALKRRGRVEKSSNSYELLPKGTKKKDIPDEAFEPLNQKDLLNMEDSLFGKSNPTADVLSGDSFGKCWDRMRNPVDQYGKLKPPKWSTLDKKKSIRTYLPKLAIGGETQIKLNTGIYYLTIKYSNDQIAEDNEAAIIIGEISFDNRGHVLACGADFDKLLKGKNSGAGDNPDTWFSSKVSSAPWNDGDRLRFKIDTNENSISYHNVTSGEKKTTLPNVLSYTNNNKGSSDNNKSIEVFAYCGAKFMKEFPSSSADSNRLSIIDSKKEW